MSAVRSSRRWRARGFTLVEILVGLAVMSLLAVVLFAGFRVALRSADAGDRETEATSEMRITADVLRHQLAHVIAIAQPERAGGKPQLAFTGSGEDLVFVSDAPAFTGGSGVYEVAVLVDAEGDRKRLVLARRPFGEDLFAGDTLASVQTAVLVDDLGSVRFDYFGAIAREAGPDWHEEWKDADQPPRLVRMRVAPAAGTPWPELLLPVPTQVVVTRPPLSETHSARQKMLDAARAKLMQGR